MAPPPEKRVSVADPLTAGGIVGGPLGSGGGVALVQSKVGVVGGVEHAAASSSNARAVANILILPVIVL